MATGSEASLDEEREILAKNRKFIVENLDADDVMDDLIQSRIIGGNAAQQVQLMGVSRVEKNRIIVEQLKTCGPGTLKVFCGILRRCERQSFIADQLEKSRFILNHARL